jgi:hypothetical protein
VYMYNIRINVYKEEAITKIYNIEFEQQNKFLSQTSVLELSDLLSSLIHVNAHFVHIVHHV